MRNKIHPEGGTSADKRFINEKKASEISGLSVAYFSRARWAGEGPDYLKIGSRVLYDLDSFLKWMESHKRSNTSQAS